MSHEHKVDQWLMVLTTKEASYIIVLPIVISILQISSTLLQDGYHVHFKQNSKQRRRGANQTTWISTKQTCPINSLSDGIPDTSSSSNSDTNSVTNPESISESNSNHSHCSTLLQEGGLRQWLCEAVGEHLSSRYVAQVDLSISSHICIKIVHRSQCVQLQFHGRFCSWCSRSVTVSRRTRDGSSGCWARSRDVRSVWVSYSLLQRHSIRDRSWTGQSTSAFSISSRPLLWRWWPVQLSIYSHPGIQHSPNRHNIQVRFLLPVLLQVLLRNAVASPSCRWGTETRTGQLPYAHCSGRNCTGWGLRWHMRYRAEWRSSHTWGFRSSICIWSDHRLLRRASSYEASSPLAWQLVWSRPVWTSQRLSECSCADGCQSCDAPDCIRCSCWDRRRHSRDHASGTSSSSGPWSAQSSPR